MMNILSMNESPFSSPSGSVVLYLEPVLNTYYKSYQNILTVSAMPSGPLKNMVFRMQFPKLSEFSSSSPFSPFSSGSCTYVLGRYAKSVNMSNSDSFMYADDIPSVLSYLVANGYTIDTSLTTMLQKSEIRIGGNTGYSGNRRMVCMFTYNE